MKSNIQHLKALAETPFLLSMVPGGSRLSSNRHTSTPPCFRQQDQVTKPAATRGMCETTRPWQDKRGSFPIFSASSRLSSSAGVRVQKTTPTAMLMATVMRTSTVMPMAMPTGTQTAMKHRFGPTSGHHINFDGTESGDGTFDAPWNIETDLNDPAGVAPGDTI